MTRPPWRSMVLRRRFSRSLFSTSCSPVQVLTHVYSSSSRCPRAARGTLAASPASLPLRTLLVVKLCTRHACEKCGPSCNRCLHSRSLHKLNFEYEDSKYRSCNWSWKKLTSLSCASSFLRCSSPRLPECRDCFELQLSLQLELRASPSGFCGTLVLFGRSVLCHRLEFSVQLRRGLRCKH